MAFVPNFAEPPRVRPWHGRCAATFACLLAVVGCVAPEKSQVAESSGKKGRVQAEMLDPDSKQQNRSAFELPYPMPAARQPLPSAPQASRIPAVPARPYVPVRPVVFEQAPAEKPPVQESQPLPEPKEPIHVPIGPPPADDSVQLSAANGRISLTARDAPINAVLALIAEQHGLNIVTGEEVSGRITVKVTNVGLDDVLNAILAVNGYSWAMQKDILIVSKIAADKKTSPAVQGREVRVFSLNYTSATDVDKVVKGLLSPVGQSFINQTAIADHRRTHEQLVVEDLPEYVRRIAAYVQEADAMPRQVLIEAHVLQVNLNDNCRHGVDFEELFQVKGADITLKATGLATGTLPTSMLTIEGGELHTILDLIKSTTDAKTLASPKVAVLNGQEAHLQVGGKIGYLLTTTTQTSTLQSVDFLDIGVILSVTPAITDDGQILMQVKPQVSTGRINPTTQLPESETTEVETRVMLGDGEALVIGGLIQETDNDTQIKIPFLGDLWFIGWFFQHQETVRERSEIIITLLPRIIPNVPGGRCLEQREIQQAHTPLLYGPLLQVDRTEYEPKLPSYQTKHRHQMQYCPPGPYIPEEYMPEQPPLPVEEMPVPSHSVPPSAETPPNFETPPPVHSARSPQGVEVSRRLPPTTEFLERYSPPIVR